MNEKKYPRIVVGAFIFNDNDELLIIKAPRWKNKYTVPGGKIEYHEKIENAIKREVKEETNLTISDIEFINVLENVNLGDKYQAKEKHLIFLNYKARTKKIDKMKLNEEGIEYKWLKPEECLKEDLNESIRNVIQNKLMDNESFEHKYKRALADYQNLVKRSAEEKSDFLKYANEQFILEVLPVYENLKISVEHSDNNTSDPWFEGVKYVLKQFKDILEGQGLEEIITVGKEFDINTMEAVEDKQSGENEEVNTDKDGVKDKEVVIKQVKAGYKLKGKVIIPAKVVVK